MRFELYNRNGEKLSPEEYSKVASSHPVDNSVQQERVIDRHTGRELHVSTVFLRGIPHGENEFGDPLLFETMVFDYSLEEESVFCFRYATEADAVAGHKHVATVIKDDGLSSDMLYEGLY